MPKLETLSIMHEVSRPHHRDVHAHKQAYQHPKKIHNDDLNDDHGIRGKRQKRV